MTHSYKEQAASQKAEEEDLRREGYPAKLIGQMRVVKSKLFHLRTAALIVGASIVLVGFMNTPGGGDAERMPYVLVAALLLIGAHFLRNFPVSTRVGTGRKSSLSGLELYQEQVDYLAIGSMRAAVYSVTACLVVAFSLYSFKQNLIEFYMRALDSHHPPSISDLELAYDAMVLACIGGCILFCGSLLRWYNIVACSLVLRRRKADLPSVFVENSSSLGETHGDAERAEKNGPSTCDSDSAVNATGMSPGTGLSALADSSPISSVKSGSNWGIYTVVVLVIGILTLGSTAYYSSLRKTSTNQATTEIPQSEPLGKNLPTAGREAVCAVTGKLQIGLGGEDGYTISDGDFCADKFAQVYLKMQHTGQYVPVTMDNWRHSFPNGFVMIPGNRLNDSLSKAAWQNIVATDPSDPRVKIVSSLCGLGVQVRTNEGQTAETNGYESKNTFEFDDACSILHGAASSNPTFDPSRDPLSLDSILSRFPPKISTSVLPDDVIVTVEGRGIFQWVDTSILSMPSSQKIACSKKGMSCKFERSRLPVSDDDLPIQIRDQHALLCRSDRKYEVLSSEKTAAPLNYRIDSWTEIEGGHSDIRATLSDGCMQVHLNTKDRTAVTSLTSCPGAPPYTNGYFVDPEISSHMKSLTEPHVCY